MFSLSQAELVDSLTESVNFNVINFILDIFFLVSWNRG